MSLSNPHVSSVSASVTEASVDTDDNGDAEVTLAELRTVESPADAEAHASGGYKAEVQSVSDNTVTVRVFESGYGAAEAGPLVPVTGTADVCDVTVKADGY